MEKKLLASVYTKKNIFYCYARGLGVPLLFFPVLQTAKIVKSMSVSKKLVFNPTIINRLFVVKIC